MVNKIDPHRRNIVHSTMIRKFLIYYSLLLMSVAFLADSPKTIAIGLGKIILSQSNLLTDYIQVGGIGAAFFNSGMITIFSLLILKRYNHHFNSLTISTIMLLSGFSLFGKNIVNSLPIILGSLIYVSLSKKDQMHNIVVGLLGTCLSPVVSVIYLIPQEFSFSYTLGAVLIGGAIGFIIIPVFTFFKQHTKELNLYNMGLSAGVVGVVINGLIKHFVPLKLVQSSANETTSFDTLIVLVTLFFLVFVGAIYLLLRTTALHVEDKKIVFYIEKKYRLAALESVRMLKFSIYGLLGIGIVSMCGPLFSGPVAGTVIVFASFSVYNYKMCFYLFPAVGVMSSAILFSDDLSTASVVIILLFASTLAPFAKTYGVFSGYLAGFIYYIIAKQINIFHAGINLYNCGFSGGLTVLLLHNTYENLKRYLIERFVVSAAYSTGNKIVFKMKEIDCRLKTWVRMRVRTIILNDLES